MSSPACFGIHAKQEGNDYYSFTDQYSLATFAGFAHNAEEAEVLWGFAYGRIMKLRQDIFDNYAVFLAGQRVGRR